MDVLSSQATIAGYRAVLVGAFELPKILPLLMSAAGTLAAARVFVIGAGVAGLQAIATARRLGPSSTAMTSGPPRGSKWRVWGPNSSRWNWSRGQAEDRAGTPKRWARSSMSNSVPLMASVVAESDLVITTAAIPGRPSPRLITAAKPCKGWRREASSSIWPPNAGGNCELSQADRRVVEHGVVIHGPTNLPSEVPFHASQMFSTNVTRFLLNLVKNGQIDLNLEDVIIRETLVCRGERSDARANPAVAGHAPEAAPDGGSAGNGPARSPSCDAESGGGCKMSYANVRIWFAGVTRWVLLAGLAGPVCCAQDEEPAVGSAGEQAVATRESEPDPSGRDSSPSRRRPCLNRPSRLTRQRRKRTSDSWPC